MRGMLPIFLLVCAGFCLVDGKGTFSVKILELTNYAKKRLDGTCCGSVAPVNHVCPRKCVLGFRICVDFLNAIVIQDSPVPYQGKCLYGKAATNHWGDSEQKYDFKRAIEYKLNVKFPWPRSFALILEAYDIVDSKQKFLVDRLIHRGVLVPTGQSSGWHYVHSLTPRSVGFGFHLKMQCAAQYYNSTCTMRCDPGKDGKFSCDKNGEKICHSGWMGEDCSTPICKAGCHGVHGSCSRPNECICADGWKGAYCDECKKYPGCKHGTCNNSPWTCKCFLNWGGPFCDKDLNYCGRQHPCKNGGICKNLDSSTSLKQYKCICPRGFDGENCEIKLDPCTLSPCKRGKCKRTRGSYSCTCDRGWRGQNCEININDCEENHCRNGGTCIDLDEPGFTCACAPGYKGSECQLLSPCSNSKCKHAHECNLLPDSSDDYQCVCQPGWTGKYCDENINDCSVGRCRNNGTCKDLINDYYCMCPRGYTGRNCEINEVCSSNPCLNRGICTNMDDKSYTCQCPEGFTGDRCEIAHSGCNPNPCLHGAFCYNLENDFYCQCTDKFYGKRCEHPRPYCGTDGDGGRDTSCGENDLDPCSQTSVGRGGAGRSGVCGDYGACMSKGDGRYKCDCEPGYTGEHCQLNVDDCSSSPCMHNGTCLDNIRDFDCLCPEGYQGKRCEIQIDLCKMNPCRNGAQCRPLPNDFICECTTQFYSGRLCEVVNDDPCKQQHICFNGGRCIQDMRSLNGFRCDCQPQWTGRICHIRRQEYTACFDKPCSNNGTCVNVGDGYNCLCKEGFQGKNCETNVNECNPMPCYHDGTCHDMVNSYKCKCKKGFGGPDCQINFNDCASNPCAFGATCIDKVNNFECRCPEGRRGRRCERMILDSSPKPPSCIFHRRVYDHDQTWVYNCERCKCNMGNITCQEDFCGYWSCRNADGPNDRFACRQDQVCQSIESDFANCFVPPCYPRAVCVNISERQPIPQLPWNGDSGRACRPNTATLNNNCARLLLTFNKAHLPYGITVNDVCQAVRKLKVLERRRGHVEMGISCDVFLNDENTIEVAVSSPHQRRELRGATRNSGKMKLRRPVVHEIVNDIAASLERLESNDTALVGVLRIRVETLLLDENEWGSRFLIPIICTVIGVFGVLAIILLFVYHRHRRHHILMKYAPYTTVNNARDGGIKSRPIIDTTGGVSHHAEKHSVLPPPPPAGQVMVVSSTGGGIAMGDGRGGRRMMAVGGPPPGFLPVGGGNKNNNVAASRNIASGDHGSGGGRIGRDGEVVV